MANLFDNVEFWAGLAMRQFQHMVKTTKVRASHGGEDGTTDYEHKYIYRDFFYKMGDKGYWLSIEEIMNSTATYSIMPEVLQTGARIWSVNDVEKQLRFEMADTFIFDINFECRQTEYLNPVQFRPTQTNFKLLGRTLYLGEGETIESLESLMTLMVLVGL